MSARFTLEQISNMSPSIQAQVIAQTKSSPVSSPTPSDKMPPRAQEAAKPRIRQSKGLNKTEQAFHDWLVMTYPERKVMSQLLTMRLANGCRYTPDEITYDPATSHLCAYEIKGFARDDAIVKLKVAASLFPWITFHLVTKKRGYWEIERVLA